MGKLSVEYRVLGAIDTNVYYLINKETKEMILVDPADNAQYLADQAKVRGFEPKAILITHGHFDHIYALNDLRKLWPDVPVYAYGGEKNLMNDPWLNRSQQWAKPYRAQADVWTEDGQILELAGFRIEVIATPGHTSGSCSYYLPEEKALFCGDTLFRESYGRTDLQTGSYDSIVRSLTERLLTLPEDVDVFPGHMEMTTIGHERKCNPVLREIRGEE